MCAAAIKHRRMLVNHFPAAGLMESTIDGVDIVEHDPPELPRAERRLWQAVLLRAVEDYVLEDGPSWRPNRDSYPDDYRSGTELLWERDEDLKTICAAAGQSAAAFMIDISRTSIRQIRQRLIAERTAKSGLAVLRVGYEVPSEPSLSDRMLSYRSAGAGLEAHS